SQKNSDDPMPVDNVDVALVIEEQVIIHELHNVPNTFAALIGLLYCLTMDYPNCLMYALEVVQKIFWKIGAENCTAKVHGLKNRLLRSSSSTNWCVFVLLTVVEFITPTTMLLFA
uniref:Uncharacterized protein n=1 Tax=Oncorhynchus kisutch TaxID=8019 RepID=A0A8C7DHC4_ONCKI